MEVPAPAATRLVNHVAEGSPPTVFPAFPMPSCRATRAVYAAQGSSLVEMDLAVRVRLCAKLARALPHLIVYLANRSLRPFPTVPARAPISNFFLPTVLSVSPAMSPA